MLTTPTTADAALLRAYAEFTRADQALRAANDDGVPDARLDVLVPEYDAAVDRVGTSEAVTMGGLLAKAQVLQRLLEADGCDSRAEELAASLIKDILRMG